MARRKPVRERGKLSFSRYFQTLEEGQKVAIKIERSLKSNIPKRFQGRTGIVVGRRGKAYIIKLKDGKKEKEFIAKPIHLIKLK